MTYPSLLLVAILFSIRADAQDVALPTRTARPTFAFGTDPQGQPSHMRRIWTMLVTSAGRIYAVDPDEHAVKIFDSTGRYLNKFGKIGELGRIMTISEEPRGVTLQDYAGAGSFRHVTYSLDGKLIASRSVSPAIYNATMREVRGVSTLFTPPPQPLRSNRQGGREFRLVVAQRTNPKRADTLAKIPTDEASLMSGGRELRVIRTGFGEGGAWALLGDSLFVHVDGYTGAIRWYRFTDSGFEITRTDSMRAGASRVSEADMNAVVAANSEPPRVQSNGSARGEAPQQAKSTGPLSLTHAPEYWSLATNALFAQDGALWVGATQARSPAGSSLEADLWTVFPADRSSPFRVELPKNFRVFAVRGNKVYGIVTRGEISYGRVFEVMAPTG